MDTKRTTDIYLASAFSALGAKLEDVDKSDPKHMVFEFSLNKPVFVSGALSQISTENVVAGTLTLGDIETQWVNKCLLVNAVEYAEAIKRLKSVVHTK